MSTATETLDELLNRNFPGKVVRKDLTKLVKEGANVPEYATVERTIKEKCEWLWERVVPNVEFSIPNVANWLAIACDVHADDDAENPGIHRGLPPTGNSQSFTSLSDDLRLMKSRCSPTVSELSDTVS